MERTRSLALDLALALALDLTLDLALDLVLDLALDLALDPVLDRALDLVLDLALDVALEVALEVALDLVLVLVLLDLALKALALRLQTSLAFLAALRRERGLRGLGDLITVFPEEWLLSITRDRPAFLLGFEIFQTVKKPPASLPLTLRSVPFSDLVDSPTW